MENEPRTLYSTCHNSTDLVSPLLHILVTSHSVDFTHPTTQTVPHVTVEKLALLLRVWEIPVSILDTVVGNHD